MEKRELSLNCSCGGTVTVKIEWADESAAGECACGRVVLWSGEKESPVKEPAPLGISVGESITSTDKFGG